MLIDTLDQKHPSYDPDLWADVDALYAGGKRFRARLSRLLVQNPMEPDQVYRQRQAEACYRSYLGPIIDYYAAWLFSDSFELRTKDRISGEPVEADAWYAQFKEDVGGDTDLDDFLRERFTSALVKQHAHWIVVFPEDGQPAPDNKADFSQRGLGNARLEKVEREELFDWELDEAGTVLWCNVHRINVARPDPGAPRKRIIETWKIYDRSNVETFQITYEKGMRPAGTMEAPSLGVRPHGCKQVPLVTMKVSDGLWVGGRVFAPQLEHFRLSCALSWAIRRSCYAMPVLHLEDGEKTPTFGTGYYLKLGLQESFTWAAPPSEPFAVIAAQVDAQRDEIYRITHQLALSVDGSTAAVGRSGESKEQDSLATRVVLRSYASDVKEAIEETFEIISDGRGDTDVTFSVEGMDEFETAGATELVANAAAVELLSIPSQTFHKELKTRVALAMVPDADQATRDAIKDEIDKGVEAQVAMTQAMNPEPEAAGATPGMGAPKSGALFDHQAKQDKHAQSMQSAPPAPFAG